MGFRAPKWFIEQEAEEERKRQEEALQPVREAEAKLTESHRRLVEFHRTEILAGRPDPEWETPQSAKTLSMSVPAAKEYVRKQSELFVSNNPDYFPTKRNSETITDYLSANNVNIANAECFAHAWKRLGKLGLIEERPEPEPIQQPEPEPEAELTPSGELMDGWDIETGQPRKYTQREVWAMTSEDMRRAFRMWADHDADRRPIIRPIIRRGF